MDVNKPCILELNYFWQALRVKSPKDAFVAFMGGNSENHPAHPVETIYTLKDNGEPNFDIEPYYNPLPWDKWIELPVREYDQVIHTAKRIIRVPTIMISVNYKDMPKKRKKPNARTLYELQNGICGYSGEKLAFKEGNIEHKIPQSKGGQNTFENLIWVKKEINFERGNQPLENFRFKPKFHHKTPAPVPVTFTIRGEIHNDWRWLLHLEN